MPRISRNKLYTRNSRPSFRVALGVHVEAVFAMLLSSPLSPVSESVMLIFTVSFKSSLPEIFCQNIRMVFRRHATLVF